MSASMFASVSASVCDAEILALILAQFMYDDADKAGAYSDSDVDHSSAIHDLENSLIENAHRTSHRDRSTSLTCTILINQGEILEFHTRSGFWEELSYMKKSVGEVLRQLNALKDRCNDNENKELVLYAGLFRLCYQNVVHVKERNKCPRTVGVLEILTENEDEKLNITVPSDLSNTTESIEEHVDHYVHFRSLKSHYSNYDDLVERVRCVSNDPKVGVVTLFIGQSKRLCNLATCENFSLINDQIISLQMSTYRESICLDQREFSELKSPVIVHLSDYSGFVHHEDLSNAFIFMQNVQSLKLSAVDKVPFGIEALQNITVLDLSDSSIKQLPEIIFELNQLKTLNLSNTKLQSLSPGIRRLVNLRSILLMNTGILNLPDLSSLFKLEIFKFKAGSICYEESLVDEDCHGSLEHFNSSDVLSGTVSIINCQNFLKVIPKNICELCMSNLGLKRFPFEISTMIHLESLDISKNKIPLLPIALFSLKKLKYLNISINRIVVEDGNVDHASPLLVLNLGYNPIRSIPVNRIRFITLTSLYLNKCQLTDISVLEGHTQNLKILDLSRNSISMLPFKLFDSLRQIRHLNINWNFIGYLPNCFQSLENIEIIDVSHNDIKEIPVSIGYCKKLKILDLGFNVIEFFPDQISELNHLCFLYLQCNHLKIFPNNLSFPSLTVLKLGGNQLMSFPEIKNYKDVRILDLHNNKICNVTGEDFCENAPLHYLNVSKNKMTKFPFQALNKSTKLVIDENPLSLPPPEILTLGLKAIQAYFSDLEMKQVKITPEVKLIVIGNSGVGKTTLCRQLTKHGNQLPSIADRTRVVECSAFKIGVNECCYNVHTFDMAGHHIYESTHRIFFSSYSIYILNVNLPNYSSKDFYSNIGKWYEMLMCYSPKCALVVVASHEDQIRHKIDIENKLQTLNDDLAAYVNQRQSAANGNVEMPKVLESVSINCKDPNHIGYAVIKNLIYEACEAGTFIRVIRVVPFAWQQFQWLLRDDPNLYYLSLDHVKELAQASKITDLETVLEYLSLTGKILYFNSGMLSNYVFHKPLMIIGLLKSVFHHDAICDVQQKSFWSTVISKLTSKNKVKIGDKLIEGAKKKFLISSQIEAIKLNVEKAAIFSDTALDILFKAEIPNEIETEVLLDILKRFQYCYELKSGALDACFHVSFPEERYFCFPCYLKDSIPSNEVKNYFPNNPEHNTEEREIYFELSIKCVEIITRLLVLLYQHISYVNVIWRTGMVAMMDQTKVYIVSTDGLHGGLEIRVTGRTSTSSTHDLHQSLWHIYNCCVNLLASVPGIKYWVGIKCPSCHGLKKPTPHKFPLRKWNGECMEGTTCPQCQSLVSAEILTMVTRKQIGTKIPDDSVAMEMGKDWGLQMNWEFLAARVHLGHAVEDIKAKAQLAGKPGPSYCVYLFILQLIAAVGNSKYLEVLHQACKNMNLIDTAEKIEDLTGMK